MPESIYASLRVFWVMASARLKIMWLAVIDDIYTTGFVITRHPWYRWHDSGIKAEAN
jgi:hypothetical protein